MEEVWKPVVGYDGFYEVSSQGRVRSLDRIIPHPKRGIRNMKGKLRKTGRHIFGYPVVGLYARGTIKVVAVHTLILEAFVGLRKIGHHACHNDGDPSNSVLANLRWDTVAGNHFDKRLHGTHQEGEKNPACKITAKDVVEIRAAKGTHKEIAMNYGVSRGTISSIRRRQSWASVS